MLNTRLIRGRILSVRFNANLTFQHGHPILTITLPSRNQPVAFTCKPVTGTVGSLINDIIKEDGGVHQADIRTEGGGKLSRSTSISQLLCLEKFILTCNGVEHVIEVPEKVSSKVYQPSVPADNGVNEMRYQVARLYTALNIEAHQFAKEEELLREKESLMKELKPYLELNDQIRAQADRQALLIQYGVLAYMCGLWGVLFRLTWWEYSWDIMEPITYFITYGTSIGLYGFYNYTKTAPEYQAVERRYKLMYTHKFAAKNPGFNIDDFNEKMRKLANLNENLLRLRDPLRLQLPIRQIRHSSTVDLY
jgi:hypothetical protein